MPITRHSSPVTTQLYQHQQQHYQPQYQFFHFPSLPLSSSSPSPSEDVSALSTAALPPSPPATTQYWTSDSTRRLEYAAIDAASKGIKGLLVRLMPDCILPPDSRSGRRCRLFEAGAAAGRDADVSDDAGSVRRYRLVLEGEKSGMTEGEEREEVEGRGRMGLLRKLTGSLTRR